MMFVGIDLGSRFVKIVSDDNGERRFFIIDTVEFYKKFGTTNEKGFHPELSGFGVESGSIICATGYGRNNLKIVGANVISEIQAHALGASYQSGLDDFLLLDLGGQDSKVIVVSSGVVVDFVANDRCAASTGRYLENMARILGMDITELGTYWRNPAQLSSTCAIFGESELINLISHGEKLEHLAAGVNYSIVKRVKPFLLKYKDLPLVLSGGVAFNTAIKKFLAEMGFNIIELKYPQYNGAIGCIVFISKNLVKS